MAFSIEDPDTHQCVELTPENTTIMLFTGDNQLDHIVVRRNDHNFVCYDARVRESAINRRQFPVMLFPFRPNWAIERRMSTEVFDLEKLLDTDNPN